MKTALTEFEKEEIEHMREVEGATFKAIAKHLGKSRYTVRSHCLRNGVELPKEIFHARKFGARKTPFERKGQLVIPFTKQEDRLLLKLEAEGITYSEIGRRMNRARTTIRDRLSALARKEELRVAGYYK